MKRVIWIAVTFALLFAVGGYAQLTAPAAGPDNSPKVGDVAPDVPLPMNDAGAKSIKDFSSKKKVLLLFFPGAFTRGCTTEFTEAGQMHDKFVAMNIEMIGISRDLPGAQAAFKTSVGAKNIFVSDPELKVTGSYDAVSPTRVAKRYYFLIDENGKVAWKNVSGGLIPTEKLLADLGQVRNAN